MRYSDYKKGYGALRYILNHQEAEYSRQFATFRFTPNGRSRDSTDVRGIYNHKTKNIVAFINRQGKIFIRPTSVYYEALKGTKHELVVHNKLKNFRGKIPNHVKMMSSYNIMAESATDRLLSNKDKDTKVFLFKFQSGQSIDERFIIKRISNLLKDKKLPNTIFALNERALVAEEVPAQKMYSVYLNVEDRSEAIAKAEREERIKREVATAFLGNIREIARDCIVSRRTMNPVQFTFTDSEEVLTTGRISLNRVDLNFPSGIPLEEVVNVDSIIRFISIEENVGSLASRGINEMELTAQQDVVNRLYQYHDDNFTGGLGVDPGSITIDPQFIMRSRQSGRSIAVPRMSYTEVTEAWGESVDVPQVVHHEWTAPDITPF